MLGRVPFARRGSGVGLGFYWTFVDEQRDNLELGGIELLGGTMLDVSLDDDA